MYKEIITNLELGVFVETIYKVQREIMEKMVLGVVNGKRRIYKIKEEHTKDNEKEQDAKDATDWQGELFQLVKVWNDIQKAQEFFTL